MPAALITGGHGGIGYECARRLAAGPRLDLILAGRDLTRVEPAAQRLRIEYEVRVTALELDTSSLASVREAAVRCRAMMQRGEVDALQAVICNAGARIEGVNYTPDGYEETFATNHLGHFLLIELLIDCMAENGRVVFTASGTHDPETMDGKLVGAVVEPNAIALANDGKDGRKPTSAGKRYSTSKLCNILHAYELHRRLRRSGSSIASIAFDPGSTAGTGLLRGLPKFVQWLATTAFSRWLQRGLGVTMGEVEFSGSSLGKIAADPAFADASGKYFQSNDGRLLQVRSSKMSYDEQRATRLWNDSRELVHLLPGEEPALLR
jgi:NAD(P)-dependent dehydrogenase (short-subunit alcohol dehydrogenase family)